MKKLIFSITTTLFLSSGLSAQDSEDPKVLTITFKEAVEVALKENVNLRQQKNLLESRQATRLGARFNYLPTVSLNGTYQKIDGQQFDQVQGILAFTQSDRFNASLDASLTLFNGFNRSSTLRQANYSFMAQENAVERSRQQLIFNVSQQYLQILLNKELLKIAEDNLELQKTNFEQIKGFVESGTRAKPDLYTQEALVEQLEVLKIRAENNYRRSKAALMQTLLLEPGVDIDPQTPSWDINNVYNQNLVLDELYNIALANRPDLKQNEYVVKAARRSVVSSTSGYYPTLTAFFSYGSSYSSLVANTDFIATNNFSTIGYLNGDPNQPVTSSTPDFQRQVTEVDFDQQFFDNNPVTVYGLRLTIPIFDRFQTRTQRVTSKINYENATLDSENLERTVYLDIQTAFLDFQASKEDYEASTKQYDAAKKSLEVQQERFDLGIGNLVELSQANNTYVLGAASRAQSVYTLLFQKIILDFNLGTLKFEDIQ